MSKLCVHLLPGAQDCEWAIKPGKWVKVCNAGLITKLQREGMKVYYRPYLPDDGDCHQGNAWALAVWDELQKYNAQPDAIGFRNEISSSLNQVAAYLSYRATLRDKGYRGIITFGSFSVGNPGLGDWGPIWAAFGDTPPDALELHEYFDLTVGGCTPYYVGRWAECVKRGLIPPTIPIFIGELGSDALAVEDIQKRRGWRDRNKLTAQAYTDQLRTYDGTLTDQIVAAFVFADGDIPDNWPDFGYKDVPLLVGAIISSDYTGGGNIVMPLEVQSVPTLNQGPTDLCWCYAVEQWFAAYGHYVGALDLYRQVKGKDYVPPGEPATFDELRQCVEAAYSLTGIPVKLYNGDGYVYDLNTFDQLLRDHWCVIAGIIRDGTNYGHYISVSALTFDANGVAYVQDEDSYHNYDGDTGTCRLDDIHRWMVNNWTGPQGQDALAFRFI